MPFAKRGLGRGGARARQGEAEIPVQNPAKRLLMNFRVAHRLIRSASRKSIRSLRIFEQTAPPSLREGTPPNLGGEWPTSVTARNRFTSHPLHSKSLRAPLCGSPSILSWTRLVIRPRLQWFSAPMQRRDPAAQILKGNVIEIYGSEPFGQFCLGRKLPDRIRQVLVCLFIAGNHGAYSRQNVTEVEIEQGRQYR